MSIRVNRAQILRDLMEKYNGDEEKIARALQGIEADLMGELSHWFQCISDTLNNPKFMPVIVIANVTMVGGVRIHGDNAIEAGFGSTDNVRDILVELTSSIVQQTSKEDE